MIVLKGLLNKGFCVCSRFYPSPYSIATNRMITQTSITPYIASPVSAYQVCTFRIHQEYDNLPTMNHGCVFMYLKILNVYNEILSQMLGSLDTQFRISCFLFESDLVLCLGECTTKGNGCQLSVFEITAAF